MADPRLQLYAGSTVLASNDDWAASSDGGSSTALSNAFAASGAFGLAPTTKDSALLRVMSTGSYTAEISGAGTAATGTVLAELYDTAPSAGARLVNVSARSQVSAGGDPLVAGFSISGNVPRRVLIRAIGPALSAFGVPGTLANPRLNLYLGTSLIQSNDNWGFPDAGGASSSALTAAFASVGAFPLADPLSLDAALLVTLPPGTYTAQVSGGSATGGVALIEVYEVP